VSIWTQQEPAFWDPASPGAYQLDRPCTDANVPDEYLTLNGAHISGTTVSFTAANLGIVGYLTGTVSGSNAIAIESSTISASPGRTS
jgi:hypothetical protein